MASRRARATPPSAPRRNDIDVDDELQQLLKEQEEFMRQRSRPAAKITRVGGTAAAVASSPVAERMADTQETKEDQDDVEVDEGPQVVGLVKERDVISLDGSGARRVYPPLRVTSGGFPAVRKRGESLFGRRARQPTSDISLSPEDAAAKLSGKGKIVERTPAVMATASGATHGLSRSDVVSEAEWNEIDATNSAALRNMSTADIRAAQQELVSMLDPALLEKLKSRRQPKPQPVRATTTATITSDATKREDVVAATKRLAAAGIDLSKIETEDQLFAEAAKLPVEERAKHAWMQPVETTSHGTEATPPVKTKTGKSRLPVRANQPKRAESKASGERFDFNGDVVDGADHAPSHSGLYHHGDDPDAAGYTMDELLHLARSTVASQRVVALRTIGKILRKRSQGGRVAPEVLPAELSVALRMALDDQNYTALSAAIAALHAFLCSSNDEGSREIEDAFESARGTVLQTPRIHLHVDVGTTADELLHEVIYIDTNESDEDGSKIGDQELSSLDPVQGLVKMTIVPRLCFIVTTIQLPDEDAMDKLLDVLIHIAAHSPRAAQAVAADRELMKALQTKYLENGRVLTLETEPAEAFAQAAARTLKTLRLVRVLCQGSRAVATLFVESGVVQTTKGFLALRADQVTDVSSEPLEAIQLESLRVWRVLLEYGLDFHCFAYLYPLLCGFDGVHLVRDKADSTDSSRVKRWSDRCLAAIFAALEAFARLDTVHEAQHYFNQFGFFSQLAADEIARRLPLISSEPDRVSAVALRFLTTCSGLVHKFHLDRSPFTMTFKLLQTQLASASWRDQLLSAPDGPELLVAATAFGTQVLSSDLIGDDQDEGEARKQFFLTWKLLVSNLVARDQLLHDSLRTCELLLIATDAFLRTEHHDDAFIRSLYIVALEVVQDLRSGHQFWIHSLFSHVLFHPIVLQKTGFFPDLHDATTMGRVLMPIYQALVNSTKEQEDHSQLLFAPSRSNPKQKQSCHLLDPQDEHEYVGSNLPLPFFWMFCPFSRVEYASQANHQGSQKQKHAATSLGPSHAEADEMKVIVSAACRYIDQLESTVGAVRSASSNGVELGDEDKLFHLMHVFFAGTDVLFDEYVDLALSKLLKKYVLSVLKNTNPTALYDGILRNLRQFESIEAGENRDTANQDSSDTPTSFTTKTQTVMTFVERLVNEFTSSSFGNTHFARLVTLFLLHDFPLEIRKWVWKELAGSHLLHRLEPFGGTEARGATGLRATRDAKRSDETLIRTMTQAIATRQSGVVSHERGLFAYWLTIHHTVAYVFGDGVDSAAEFSSARQRLLQDLVANASPIVWRHLLSHDTTAFAPSAEAEIKPPRVNRVLERAALSESQAATFRLALASLPTAS